MEARKILATKLKVEDLEGKKLKVGYKAGGVKKWKLFFDGEKLHLIAADYVPTRLMNLEGYHVEKGRGEYTIFMSSNAANLIAWLKDPAKWEMFAAGIPGAKAAGGPTIEQFCGCWNVMNQQQKVSPNDRWIDLERPKKLFVPHKDIWNDCRGYWLASTAYSYGAWHVHSYGCVSNNLDSSCTYGVRPLVTPPSDIGLQYDEERKMWLIV